MRNQITEMDIDKIYTIIVDVGDMVKSEAVKHLTNVKALYDALGIKAVYSAVVDGVPLLTIDEIDRNILPVGLNDKLYIINEGKIYPVHVTAIKIDNKKNGKRICVAGTFHYSDDYTHDYKATFTFDSLGKTLFRSEEEAKAKLRLQVAKVVLATQ